MLGNWTTYLVLQCLCHNDAHFR